MVEDKWLLLAAIPVVVFLSFSIWRRARELNAKIEQLKREEAAGPVSPYQSMYEMMSGQGDGAEPRQPSPLLLKAMGKAVDGMSPPSKKADEADGEDRQ